MTVVMDSDASYLRTSQVAELLQVSPKTISRWAKDGKLPFLTTLGGHRRYPRAAIEELAGRMGEHGEGPEAALEGKPSQEL